MSTYPTNILHFMHPWIPSFLCADAAQVASATANYRVGEGPIVRALQLGVSKPGFAIKAACMCRHPFLQSFWFSCQGPLADGKGKEICSSFRKSQPWLRFPEDADGEPVPISTKSLAYNVEVLSTYFSHVGLRTAKVKTLTKEVLWAQR